MENAPELECSKKLSIPNQLGEKMVGIFQDTGAEDVAILCHGFRTTKDLSVLCRLATGLAELGLSSYRFDFSGNGESDGEFQYGTFSKDADDLHSVVEYWKSKGHHVKYIMGHSKGGNAVLLYAAKYGDVPNVINISGRFDLKIGIEIRLGDDFLQVIEENGFMDVKDKHGKVEYRVTKEGLWNRINTDMAKAASNIPETCRVLTVHGSEDEVIPVSDAHQFATAIANHKLLVVEGADHYYTNHLKEVTQLVLQYIKSLES